MRLLLKNYLQKKLNAIMIQDYYKEDKLKFTFKMPSTNVAWV
jgi:hypothetical protein